MITFTIQASYLHIIINNMIMKTTPRTVKELITSTSMRFISNTLNIFYADRFVRRSFVVPAGDTTRADTDVTSGALL